MADLASDNFNRGDGGLGANWSTMVGQSAPQIRSQLVEDLAVGGAAANALYTAVTWPNDQYAYCTAVTCATGSSRQISLFLRMATADITGYAFELLGPTGTTATLRVRRFNAGTPTTLADTGATQTVNAGAVLRAEIIGAVYTFSVDGTPLISDTDATPITGNGGFVGIGVQTGAGTTADAQLDTFGGGPDLATPITGLGRRHQGFIYGRP